MRAAKNALLVPEALRHHTDFSSGCDLWVEGRHGFSDLAPPILRHRGLLPSSRIRKVSRESWHNQSAPRPQDLLKSKDDSYRATRYPSKRTQGRMYQ